MAAEPRKRKRAGRAQRLMGPCVLDISIDQRRCLIEDLAYFRAVRYRRLEPGNYRKQDLAAAEAEIETVLERYAKRKGG
jgi:hypothetical protein